MSRPEVVDQLARALLDTLMSDLTQEPTADEMFSASLTLVNRMVEVILRLGGDPNAMRAGLNQVASQLPIITKTVH